MDTLIQVIAYGSVAAGVVCVVVGLAYAFQDLQAQSDARQAAKRGAALANTTTEGGFQQQADVAPAFEALAKLAAALKDLDKSNRYFVLALGFFGVAALCAGVKEVTSAIEP